MNQACRPPAPSGPADPTTFSFGRTWDDFVCTALLQKLIDISPRCRLEGLRHRILSRKSLPGSASGRSLPAEYDARVEEIVFLCRDEFGGSFSTPRRQVPA